EWFQASLAAPGAPEAFASDGGFRAHFLSGPENALRHRNPPRTHLIRTGLAEAFRSPRHKAAITLVSRSLLSPVGKLRSSIDAIDYALFDLVGSGRGAVLDSGPCRGRGSRGPEAEHRSDLGRRSRLRRSCLLRPSDDPHAEPGSDGRRGDALHRPLFGRRGLHTEPG